MGLCLEWRLVILLPDKSAALSCDLQPDVLLTEAELF